MITHVHRKIRSVERQRTTIDVSEVINGEERFCYQKTIWDSGATIELWPRSIDEKRQAAVLTYVEKVLNDELVKRGGSS